MDTIIDNPIFRIASTLVVSAWAWFVGTSAEAVYSAFGLMALDFCLGVYRSAILNQLGGFKRDKVYGGIKKISLYIIFLLSARAADINFKELAPFVSGKVFSIAVVYISMSEFLSISSHLTKMGVKLPICLIKRVEAYRDGLCKYKDKL